MTVWAFQQLLWSREIPIHYNVEDCEECGITGDGGQRTEIRDQMTDVRGQSAYRKNQKSEKEMNIQRCPRFEG